MTAAVISLGAGVQSSTMLLMAAADEFGDRPELAIFADTGWEPAEVYRHLDWLEDEVAGKIEVARVAAGNLRNDLLAVAAGDKSRSASPPLFTRTPHRLGMVQRQCTREYKVEPIERELRRRGFGGRGDRANRVQQWVGISFDELVRMKPSRTPWVDTRWPLIERRLTRADCLRWFEARYPGRRLVKSACIGCPYHSDARWREVQQDAEAWADAVNVDQRIRRLPGLQGEAFLHRQRIPLGDVDLSTLEDRGQLTLDEECEGVCFV